MGDRRARRFAWLIAAAAICVLAAACGSAALAFNGGAAAPGEESEEPGDPSIRLSAKRVAYVGRALSISGAVTEGRAREVRIEARDEAGAWYPVATVQPERDGSFAARWRPASPGRFVLRAVVTGASSASTGGTDTRTSSTRPLTVYRLATATWYGPGFYGNRTACGLKLTRRTLGVAHKRLPCGTDVELAYRGRTITVPVIDRGPYARGITWDLTSATAQALGFRSTSRVGAVAIAPGR